MKTFAKSQTVIVGILTFVLAITMPYAATYAEQITPLPHLLTDLEKLAGKENPARLTALSQLLHQQGVPSEIEPYTYTKDEFFEGEEDPSDEEMEIWNSLSGKGENLVVTLGSGDKTVVLGAHYDRVPEGEGIVDNGASSLILVRIAAALQHQSLNYRLKIVWFGDEEVGLIGSKKFVAAHEGENIVSMINLDVNAYGNTTLMGPTNATGENQLYKFAKNAAFNHGLKFTLFPEYGPSDDISFTEAGIEAISIGIAPVAEAYEFWLALNTDMFEQLERIPTLITNIHSDRDALSKADPVSMTQSYLVALGILQELNTLP